MKTAKHVMTATLTTDAKITNAGPRIAIILLDAKAKVWSALSDNVNLTIISGELHVKLMTTVVVMLSPVMKDTAGVLNVSKVLKPLEFKLLQIMQPLVIL